MRTARGRLILFFLLLVLSFSLLCAAAANAESAKVSGIVYLDRNANGKRDGNDSGLVYSRVVLEQKTADGVKSLGSKAIESNGVFSFSVSQPGDYRLRIELPKDYYFTVYGDGSKALPAQNNRSYTAFFTLKDGDSVTQNIGGCRNAASFSIVAFIDANANGGRASNEKTLRGVTAELLYEINGKEYTAIKGTTDKNGSLSFRDMSPGTYRIKVTLPENYVVGPKGDKGGTWYNRINPSEDNIGYSDRVTVGAGHSLSLGVGAVKTGSLKGVLWLDANANGKRDSSEKGLTSAVIKLSNDALKLTRTTKPDASGNYSFKGLQPGEYEITVQLPDGYIFTYPGNTLISSISSTGTATAKAQTEKTVTLKDIGVMRAASASFVFFSDDNMNGVRDDGEKALSGVSVTAEQNKQKVNTVRTGANGTAEFSVLRSGAADFSCSLPDGYILLMQEDSLFDTTKPVSSGKVSVKLNGSGKTAYSIPCTLAGAITGRLFEDPVNEGKYTADCKLLSDFTVQAVSKEKKVLARTVTDASGAYTLSPLPAGEYTVRFLLKDRYVASPATEDNDIDHQTPSYGETAVFALKAGETAAHVDGAVFQAGIVYGYVRNAQADGGVRGIIATLMQADGQPVSDHAYGTTDDQGYFRIKGVLPGTYFVRYQIPDTVAMAGDYAGRKTIDTASFAMTSGVEYALNDLSGVYTASVSGFVGRSKDQPVAAAVTLTNGETGETMEASVSPEGKYSFSALLPGKYTFTVALPEGFVIAESASSPVGPVADHTASAVIDLRQEQKLTANVLAAYPVRLCGTLFYDVNQSGTQDEKEKGVANRAMTLLRSNQTVAELKTDKNGAFQAENLVPGTYTLEMKLTNNEILTDGKAEQKGKTCRFSLSIEGDTDVIIPILRYGSIAGSVWNLDSSTTKIKGLTIRLLDSSGKEIASDKSDSKGGFYFDQLVPGSYTLSTTLPSGYLFARKQDTSKRSSYIQNAGDGKTNALPITVTTGQEVTGADIGIGKMGDIGDKAWLDENGNGMQDIGESPMPGIKIELYQNKKLIASTTTDLYGRYSFKNLYPGEYTMRVTMHKELKTTKKQTKFPLVASILPDNTTKTTVTATVNVPKDGLHCDLGFQLRKAGKYPAIMKKIPTKNWKPYSER